MDSEDPRITGDYVRRLSGADGDVVLVGVVHDHPASKYRVQTVIEERDPETLALELPPLAVPLFEVYAEDDRTPPTSGGEMSAAIQAAGTDRIVGVDGPSPRFVARLARTLYRDDASLGTARRVLGSLASVTRHAVTCRLAATLTRRLGVEVDVDSPVEHDCAVTDEPRVQADDEQSQIRQVRHVLNAFEPASSAKFRTETREAHMADRLDSLRSAGDVVAVVGIDHLEPLCERLGDGD